MRGMLRRLPFFLFVFATLLIAEPLLHNHTLQQLSDRGPTSGSACAVCATGVGRLPVIITSVAVPQTIVYTLAMTAVTIVTLAFALPLASRAPPAQ